VVGPFVYWPLTAAVNSVVTGLAMIASGLVRGEITSQFGGGWRSIWRDDIDTVTGRDPG
jgi:hypothetical protein